MAPQINANLSDVAALDTLTTLDGRTIKVNSFTVLPAEPIKPAVDLSTVEIGDRFVTYDGRELEYVGATENMYKDSYPYFFRSDSGHSYSYTQEGVYLLCGTYPSSEDLKEKVSSPSVDLRKASVGDQYITRGGDVFELEGVDEGVPYPYRFRGVGGKLAGTARTYTATGLHSLLAPSDSAWILVKKVKTAGNPRVDISSVKVGDVLKLRDGRQYAIDRLDIEHPWSGFAHTTNGWYSEDGTKTRFSEGNDDVIEVIPAPKAPRVDISSANVGDTLELRDGTRAIVQVVDFWNSSTRRCRCDNIGWFYRDGSLKYANDDRQDVVKVIPAPQNPLRKQISERLQANTSGKVDHVVVNIDDWYELLEDTSPNVTINGTRVLGSATIARGAYQFIVLFES